LLKKTIRNNEITGDYFVSAVSKKGAAASFFITVFKNEVLESI